MLRPEVSEPVYSRGGRQRAMLNTATHSELRKFLKESTSQTELAIETVETQLRLWKESQNDTTVSCKILGLDVARLQGFKGYLGENVEEDVGIIGEGVQKLEANHIDVLKKGIWSWHKLPYPMRRVGSVLPDASAHTDEVSGVPRKKAKILKEDELIDDVDEWVLKNEIFLRSFSKCPSSGSDSVLGPCCSPVISSGNLIYALQVTRSPTDVLPGYTILADKRPPTTFIQPSSADFKRRFDFMTGGLLAGLDWNNVFVAGGLVLGALLTPDIPSTASVPALDRLYLNQYEEWISSDIDLYIYGLDVDAANKKIQHIAEVYKSNLGSADAPFLVVRNSQTITLYSMWPKRRVQIVLKLVKSPREVLLNFDLDVCAAGWDGTEVWMLPSFTTAGTNVFTMDLINGHYLGDRKATRDKRFSVFKYAKRGYGIRILPIYIGWLSPFQSLTPTSKTLLASISLGEKLQSREWTRQVVQRYIKNGQSSSAVTYWFPEGRWPRVEGKNGLPVFSHAMLEGYGQITSEPLGRSSLTGFGLLMRHVALWEMERAGEIEIYEHIFAEDAYNNIGQVAYDDTPVYEWDENFNIEDFTKSIDGFNDRELDSVKEEWRNSGGDDLEFPIVKRVTYASSVAEILSPSHDIVIPVITTEEFATFANSSVVEALKMKGVLGNEKMTPLTVLGNQENQEVVITVWRLNKVLNWQMVDRPIDEIREVLWAFHRANERLIAPDTERTDYLRTNLSKRAIRISEKDENHAFVRWVGREPYQRTTDVNGIFLVEDLVREFRLGDDESDSGSDE
ncbi:hypothetical protein BDP27DRAFT_1402854 [Rhodocollybia butyracea]|uniref:Uncharacterized protein n=1 Tax=Rhodocollybia butyracea TaxID=206335 RepID=A0A9P5U6T1_9AGAR|nr:hypothetical protein BDP27DRAFT_1402854 [Rhodocollybia butyracea]